MNASTQIMVGHVLDRLAEIPDESIHMAWTSPPYWGLRAYGTEPQVWGGDPACPHIWRGVTLPLSAGRQGSTSARNSRANVEAQASNRDRGHFCERCRAWRGEHGMEPSLELWLDHEILIFREVWRVLRTDGTLWINIGDAYCSGAGFGFKPKDRLLMPARLAIALQDDGWWLRDEIVWHKKNPMPSSVTDRTTPAHEMVYMLSKASRYYYDAAAIREPFADGRQGQDYKSPDGWDMSAGAGGHGSIHREGREKGRKASERNRGGRDDGFTKPNAIDPSANGGRNKRSVWSLAAEPYKEAHFATAPTALVSPYIRAGTSQKGVCPSCGAPWVRETETTYRKNRPSAGDDPRSRSEDKQAAGNAFRQGHHGWQGNNLLAERTTLGWIPSCACPEHDHPIPATVLDPFGGAGTTGLVANQIGRDCVLIDLSQAYAELAQRRLRQGLQRVASDLPEPENPHEGLPLFDDRGVVE